MAFDKKIGHDMVNQFLKGFKWNRMILNYRMILNLNMQLLDQIFKFQVPCVKFLVSCVKFNFHVSSSCFIWIQLRPNFGIRNTQTLTHTQIQHIHIYHVCGALKNNSQSCSTILNLPQVILFFCRQDNYMIVSGFTLLHQAVS